MSSPVASAEEPAAPPAASGGGAGFSIFGGGKLRKPLSRKSRGKSAAAPAVSGVAAQVGLVINEHNKPAPPPGPGAPPPPPPDSAGGPDESRGPSVSVVKKLNLGSPSATSGREGVPNDSARSDARSEGRGTKSKSGSMTLGARLRAGIGEVSGSKSGPTGLMGRLRQTSVHYIRCVKPNDSMAAYGFEQQRVLLQLQCSGILEMVRIRRQGFPSVCATTVPPPQTCTACACAPTAPLAPPPLLAPSPLFRPPLC